MTTVALVEVATGAGLLAVAAIALRYSRRLGAFVRSCYASLTSMRRGLPSSFDEHIVPTEQLSLGLMLIAVAAITVAGVALVVVGIVNA